MKTMLLAAVTLLGISATAASASEGATKPNSWFTELPGVVAQAPVQQMPAAIAQNQNAPTAAFVTSGRGTVSLFAPNGNEGANN